MHTRIKAALEELDAAVINSDAFHDADARRELLFYMTRWSRRLVPRCAPRPAGGGAGPYCYTNDEFCLTPLTGQQVGRRCRDT